MFQIGTKKTLADVWPIRNKRFFITADYPSLMERERDLSMGLTVASVVLDEETLEGTVPPPAAISSTYPTIQHVINSDGKVIIGCTFSQLAGLRIKMSTKAREAAMESFKAENGLGYTLFFSNLSAKEKMHVLGQLTDVSIPKRCGLANGTGKTTFFASLTNEQKRSALRRVFPARAFQFDVEATTFPLVQVLKDSIQGVGEVHFVEDPLNAFDVISKMAPGSIVVLENLRFYSNETSEKPEERLEMARVLATYADVYIDDCFRSAHRPLASTNELPRLLKHGAAGFLMEKELLYFDRVLTHPARPTCAIVGGNRVLDKLHLIRHLLGKVDAILIAGLVALPFIAAKNWSAGKGYEAEHTTWDGDDEPITTTEYAARLLSEALQSHIRIVLPVDFVAHHSMEPARSPVVTTSPVIPRDLFAVDVGPNTVNQFGREIRECRTVVWAGPLGCVDIEGFDVGTIELARILAASNVLSIVGGKQTTDAVKRGGVALNISHLSSGSNCALELLRGNPLPGVVALSDAGISAALSEASASITDLLRHLPLFAGCSAGQLQIIARNAVRRNHNLGDFIINEGDCYTSMWIVAQGELLCCPRALFGKSLAVRSLKPGHAAGQWEFISQQFSSETVQVGAEDTVTYQVTAAALHECLNESPDLAPQLLANCAEPLRVFAHRQHAEQATEIHALALALQESRKPLANKHQGRSFQYIRAFVTTALLHSLTVQYLPFRQQHGTFSLAAVNQGLPLKLVHVLMREVTYMNLTKSFSEGVHGSSEGLLGPVAASMATAALASPIELASRGVPFQNMTIGELIDNAVRCATSSLAPSLSHALYLYSKSGFELSARQEDHSFEQLSSSMEFFLTALSRLGVGLLMFPIIIRRAPQNFTVRHLMLYLLRQMLVLCIEVTLRHLIKRRKNPPHPPSHVITESPVRSAALSS